MYKNMKVNNFINLVNRHSFGKKNINKTYQQDVFPTATEAASIPKTQFY